MGMTMTQKILAAHAGLKEVKAGRFIEADIDIVLGNDITAPVAIKEFNKMSAGKVYDRSKVVLVPDHFTPNKDIKAAEQCKLMREFAHEQDIINYFEVGEMGIEHALLPEKGLVVAGDAVIGADSHTCTYGALGMARGKAWFKVPSAIRFELTGKLQKWVSGKDVILHIIGMIGVDGALYKSMEFMGPGLSNLSMDDRFTMANMVVEAGAKNGIFMVDEKTEEYMAEHKNKNKEMKKRVKIYAPDIDAVYDETYVIDLSKIRPTVAFPHLPENTKTIDDVGDIKIDQVVIGSCTNGRMEDMKAAAGILKGKKVAKNVRLIIIPGTQKIYLECVKEGYAEIFIKAGAVFSTPTCGPCLGGHMGILAAGERAVATTNRNFVGRMGHTESEIYLASPAVAAATAVTGRISSPEDL